MTTNDIYQIMMTTKDVSGVNNVCFENMFMLVSNIEEQLCIVFMYTGNLSIISTISQFESD